MSLHSAVSNRAERAESQQMFAGCLGTIIRTAVLAAAQVIIARLVQRILERLRI